MSKMAKKIWFIVLILVALLFLSVMLWSENGEQEKYREVAKEHQERIRPTDDNSIRIIDKTNNGHAASTDGTVIVDFDEFKSNATRTSYLDARGATVSFKLNNDSNGWGGGKLFGLFSDACNREKYCG